MSKSKTGFLILPDKQAHSQKNNKTNILMGGRMTLALIEAGSGKKAYGIVIGMPFLFVFSLTLFFTLNHHRHVTHKYTHTHTLDIIIQYFIMT